MAGRPLDEYLNRRFTQNSPKNDPPDLIIKTLDWRGMFSPDILERAQTKTLQMEAARFTGPDYSKSVIFHSGRKRPCTTRIWNVPLRLGEEWRNAYFSCGCAEGVRGEKCVHMAALLFAWEKAKGPFTVKETWHDYRERKRVEARAAELAKREEQRRKTGTDPIPAPEAFRDLPRPTGLVFFDVESALKECVTTPYAVSRLGEAAKICKDNRRDIQIESERDGSRRMILTFHFQDSIGNVLVEGTLENNRILSLKTACSDRDYYWPLSRIVTEPSPFDPAEPLDEYQLFALRKAWNYMLTDKNAGDQTDKAAKTFFKELEKAAQQEMEESAQQEVVRTRSKSPVLELLPRISIEEGVAKLSFKLGRSGSRLFVVRNLKDLAESYLREQVFPLTKKETIDFSELEMREDFLPLMQFIARRVGEISGVNEKLAMNPGRARSFSVSSFLELKGSLLDGFYDAAEGKKCEYQDKTNAVQESLIPIGHRKLQINLTSERLADARGSFGGVVVSGLIPVLIRGSSSNYILNAGGLSRISKREEKILAPFRKVADASGYFRFSVGLENLQEFYYRVLPSLLDNPNVFLDDRTGGEVQQFLPPEPEFIFYLDCEDGLLLCRATVRYEDQQYTLYDNEGKKDGRPAGLYRDLAQENRVVRAVRRWFPRFESSTRQFSQIVDDDLLYDFLTVGVAQLEHYGTCQGTEAFRRRGVRPVPAVQMGISLDSGLMDISVTSKDLDPDELLAVFASYRQKKRYHRLRSGDFIDLSRGEELGEVDQVLQGLDLKPEDAFGKNISLPAYRALYLDRLLEEHDSIASSRSRTYRALIKNFRSIRDADYEPPQTLENTLRPYQSYGFKWLRTLEASGFGGILADEMGLGKTLQMISLFLSDKEEAEAFSGTVRTDQPENDPAVSKITPPGTGHRSSLVVCPASLVYNWEEEIHRFAPNLRCAVLAGSLPARKKILAGMDAGESDVYITSYDTLKRDILLYKNKSFAHCVLDEAQFIKNPKAAVTKAVKAIRADRRFALTGTPIENRLSELWSIFDFLMPGFLYSAADFSRRFEVPIMKEKDERSTERLRKMTGPFILRRCKEEVLKDLPEKLEEVRYARIEGEQQKIYDAQVIRMKQMLTGQEKTTAAPDGTGSTSGNMSGEDRIRIFAELTRIRQICCDPSLLLENYHGESAKRNAALELIRSAIDGGHRMLLFSQFTSMLALLEEDLKREEIPYYIITGATPKERRISLVHAFNEGDVPVFLISLKAGGTGLNLTGADVVIHYDPWWNLAVQNQATDRAHRIGQTRQVTVYRLILKDTIEEKILALQEDKKDLAEAVLAGERDSIMSLSGEELLELLS